MRHPPAITFTPNASEVYRSVAVVFTIILIAISVAYMRASGHFSLEKGLFTAVAAIACLCLLRDAWKQPQGSLHYAQGQWRYLAGESEIRGTLRLHLDLQTYMLVSFRADSAPSKLFQTTTQWFHLEARHADHAAHPAFAGSWPALRRAVYSPMEPSDAALAV